MQSRQVPSKLAIVDDHSIKETWVNGPFNVARLGAEILLTFTNLRPDIAEVLANKSEATLKATVASRLLMPVGVAEELVRTLQQVLGSQDKKPANSNS